MSYLETSDLSNGNSDSCKHKNLVYLTKVFDEQEQKSSPILINLTTNRNTFTQQLTVGSHVCDEDEPNSTSDCGLCSQCCCNNDCCRNITLSCNTDFEVTNAYAIVHSFDLAVPTSLCDNAVTVNGLAISDLEVNNGQYIGSLNDIMSEITKCPYQSPCERRCSGDFVMVSARGPWKLKTTIVVEGTVFENGTSCQFRCCFDTDEDSYLTVDGPATFASCGVEIPCQISGIAPSLTFDFDACAAVLNPYLTVNCSGNCCALTLTCSLVITPKMSMQVTRQSLFNISALEVEKPCDDVGQCNACETSQSNEGVRCQCCDTNGFGFL